MIHQLEYFLIMGIVENRKVEIMEDINLKMQLLNEHDACGIGAVVNIDGRKDYTVVDRALQIVEKLEHRAGKDASGKVGDGVGILLQISHHFFKKVAALQNINLNDENNYGIGMFFFPQDEVKRNIALKIFEDIVKNKEVKFLGWRNVPYHDEILGQKAKECMPYIMQCFVERPKQIEKDIEFERLLYKIRREFEQLNLETYICSLSAKTIVYKGMFLVEQLRLFYDDLQDHDYHSAIALVHSRFSTNTTPSWQRAHPNRMIAHNGEINTIHGNSHRMLARKDILKSQFYDDQYPIVNIQGSDSAILDNALEYLYINGMPLEKAMMLMIPEPWKNVEIAQDKKDFYHYYATMMEPWDGPAAILFSDGNKMGAILDRNGLRPARYYILDDQTLILSSEVGVLDIPEEKIIRKSRLEPGKMLLVDTVNKKIVSDEECKNLYAKKQPYGKWLNSYLLHLKNLTANNKTSYFDQNQRNILYKIFGYTYEDVKDIILPMAQNKKESLAAMGTDIPLAMLSKCHPRLFHYFKQQFAQVTNPPIDALREDVVVDTTVYLGSQGNLLQDQAKNCQVLEINNPILDRLDIDKIKQLNQEGFCSKVISLSFSKKITLQKALDDLFVKCDKAYVDGVNIFILSDRDVTYDQLIIPSLLAVSALEHHFINTKKETNVSIVLESGEPRDVHQFACLLGYGAKAIYPYLAHECIHEMIQENILDKDENQAIEDYNQAIVHGIVKIASKMGISTLQSYQSAQIFETIGIKQEVIDKYFTNTINCIGKIGLEEIEADIRYYHNHAYDSSKLSTFASLNSLGFHKYRKGKDKEIHLYNPETIVMLQRATQNNDYELFKAFSKQLNQQDKPYTIRQLLDFDFSKRKAISIDEVESIESIVKRFKTGAMSYGSISKEAHECMAIAMNKLGGKSNSGEGGEEIERLYGKTNSAIKQVASGRFGVTSEYLVSAKEIQIKMAQGAKPGEGGHLPGKKVYPWIARTRYSTPGVSLISPPPHHDIYSIEDLAQLIYDLKNANREARISVKLVSKNGVGTVACGVAKAGAEVILISGYDGGTGAANQSSIHHAGLPWEIGLLQTHQTLVENNLRTRVVLETDGKLMTGRDVAIATLLGAEEFGFATAPLVTMGCVMMRVCNLDTCPVGIATQNKELRKRFKGKPEYVINFMIFVASELREIMASLGFRTIEEMVGHLDCLKVKDVDQNIDLKAILNQKAYPVHFKKQDTYQFELENKLDMKEILPRFKDALNKGTKHQETIHVSSLDRCVGTLFGSEVTKKYQQKLNDDTFTINCIGGAGQSFGAFLPKGITMNLIGDANDYFGKGLSGGHLAIYPNSKAKYNSHDNVIIGNVALYGATSGEVYVNGLAGERFAVRNSGAIAIVEGCGDHGLEYMTGGKVVILGKTGKNLAAGMSGGIAYVLDQDHDLDKRLNKEMVLMEEVTNSQDQAELYDLINKHFKATASPFAKTILNDYINWLPHFKKLVPKDYQKIMTIIKEYEDRGYPLEAAKLEAFNRMHGIKEEYHG